MRSLGYLIAFILGMAAMVAIQSWAQTYVIGSGVAFHLDNDSHCRNHFTPGLGLERAVSENWRLSLGAYSNSNCRLSKYIAAAWVPFRVAELKIGAIAGLVTGYREAVLPAAGLAATYEWKRYKLNVVYIPPVGSSGNVLWFQTGIRW